MNRRERFIMNTKTTPIAEPIAQLHRQLDQSRSTQSRRAKTPEPLWQAAVELARVRGLHPVAHRLRNYMGLKKRLADASSPQRQANEMSFVERTPPPARLEKCVIVRVRCWRQDAHPMEADHAA